MTHYGSDLVVDLLVELGIDTVAFSPGATFRGLHDSLVRRPRGIRVVPCLHEEISVAVAHGYAKASGRIMAAIVHDVVGLQHASMAIYNAWCDRVPVLVLGSTGPMDAARRRPWIDWLHTASVQAIQVRDYTKWDDQPASLEAVPESLVRGVQVAMTEPCGPVYICLDSALQEQRVPGDGVPGPAVPVELAGTAAGRYAMPTRPAPDPAAVETLADWLVAAQRPVLLADTAGRDPAAFALLVQLAETLAVPFVDREREYNKAGLNFPTRHPLNLSGDGAAQLSAADLVLGFEVRDMFGAVHVVEPDGWVQARVPANARVAHVGLDHLITKAWSSDFQRLYPADLRLAASAAPTLAALLPQVRDRLAAGPELAERIEGRRAELTARTAELARGWRETVASAAASGSAGDDPGPVPRAYLAAVLDEVTRDRDRVLANGHLGNWVNRLWSLDRPRQYLGDNGGAGLGYGLGAAIGAALAQPRRDTLVIGVQSDGDALMTPNALWTAAHLRLPILFVMDNNRAYDNSVAHALMLAGGRGRDADDAVYGTLIDDPVVDFATLARGFGMFGLGPVSTPDGLRGALTRALAAVDGGGPALVDVLTSRTRRGPAR